MFLCLTKLNACIYFHYEMHFVKQKIVSRCIYYPWLQCKFCDLNGRYRLAARDQLVLHP